jgi:hypothetical protein
MKIGGKIMRKNYLIILMLVLCIICVGCGNKEEVQTNKGNVDTVKSGDVAEKLGYDSIEIIEEDDRIVINMFDDSTTEYILSGDFVVDRKEVFHFESEEKAQAFASSLSGDKVMIDGNDVILESNDEEKLNLSKKDLIETYKMLKDEYENERN